MYDKKQIKKNTMLSKVKKTSKNRNASIENFFRFYLNAVSDSRNWKKQRSFVAHFTSSFIFAQHLNDIKRQTIEKQ